MGDYYDRRGNRLTLTQWCGRMKDDAYRRVAFDRVGGAEVSTVWLGLDHGWGGGPPLIFETMVFGGDENEWQARYATEADAMAGHAEVVRKLKLGLPLSDVVAERA